MCVCVWRGGGERGGGENVSNLVKFFSSCQSCQLSGG